MPAQVTRLLGLIIPARYSLVEFRRVPCVFYFAKEKKPDLFCSKSQIKVCIFRLLGSIKQENLTGLENKPAEAAKLLSVGYPISGSDSPSRSSLAIISQERRGSRITDTERARGKEFHSA